MGSYEEVDYAIDRIQVGMVKSTGTSFPNRQKLVAYHEAGHAVMGLLTPGYDMVTKVTILPRTNGPTERQIDEEVKLLVSEAYEHCKAVISANREMVDEMVEDLIEKETIDYLKLQELLKKYYPDGLGTEKIPLPAKAALM